MSTTQSKYGRRFDEEFEREVAALASRPGAKLEQVARDLGVSPYSVSCWKKLTVVLRRAGEKCGWHRVVRLMRAHRLRAA